MSDYAELKARLSIKADMIQLGEKIEWGSDSALMREAAAAIDALERERDALTKAGIFEIASRNNRVTEYMFYWEDRALVAEATVASLKAQVEAMRRALERIASGKDDQGCFCGACVAARTARAALQEDKSHE